MLIDAAKQGDVEIPFFCCEAQLSGPVGACRMCRAVGIEADPEAADLVLDGGPGRHGRQHEGRQGRRTPRTR